MCYAKPGPRCASHLKADITKLETELATYNKRVETEGRFYASGTTFGERGEYMTYEQAREKVEKLRYSLAGTRAGQQELDTRISAETSPRKKQALIDLKEMAKASYDEQLSEYRKVAAENKRKREEEAARLAAEKKANARKDAVLKLLADDAKRSVKSREKTITLPKPTPSYSGYSGYSYGGKGGGKY